MRVLVAALQDYVDRDEHGVNGHTAAISSLAQGCTPEYEQEQPAQKRPRPTWSNELVGAFAAISIYPPTQGPTNPFDVSALSKEQQIVLCV